MSGSPIFRLSEEGIVAIALTFIDNSGVCRVKAVPLSALVTAAEHGVGASPCLDVFLGDDSIAAGTGLSVPDGDLRLIPDLTALRIIPGRPGWAWAPVDRYFQNGAAYPACHRLLLADQIRRADRAGLQFTTGLEIEFRLFRATDADLEPASSAQAYSVRQLLDVGDFLTELIPALEASGLEVAQFHPEAGPGQFEVSFAPQNPMATADGSVLARIGIRAVAARHDLLVSFSPMPVLDQSGNGGHVHLSACDTDGNLFSGGAGPFGMREPGQQFIAGILDALTPLTAIFNPVPVSYLRTVPSHWASAYATWGLESREAAIRLIAPPNPANGESANIEIKSPDLAASPYLVLTTAIAAGMDGIHRGAVLGDPVQGDPGKLDGSEVAAEGIRRLPTNLDDATDSFRMSHLMADTLGNTLFDAIIAVRRGEQTRTRRLSAAELVDHTRWLY
ncbi:MAG: glutamine synthetase family protein [Actinomycetes bacterium]